MIIPSIDLQGGQAVQLIGGEKLAIEAGDPHPIARKFSIAGTLAVIDLDAAMGSGSNQDLIMSLTQRYRVNVGGGIRDLEKARFWLNQGAERIILGTMAKPEILRKLPKGRVLAALDAKHGEVVVEGWKTGTGQGISERMDELKPYVSGFLITFVEREGRMGGTDLELARALKKQAGSHDVIIAGGVTTAAEVKDLDEAGCDCQVGMALYRGEMDLGDAIAAPLTSDREDGLIPTVVTDRHHTALGLVYSSKESIRAAVEEGIGIYQSRKRGLWRKGATSGAIQTLYEIRPDCDRDSVQFIVGQNEPGFCHLNRWSCFGHDQGLPSLSRRLKQRLLLAPEGSYTKRLFDDPALLHEKILEEAKELVEAHEPAEIAWEAADLIYFALTKAVAAGLDLRDIETELDKRALKVTRRH